MTDTSPIEAHESESDLHACDIATFLAVLTRIIVRLSNAAAPDDERANSEDDEDHVSAANE
jgi:hypothetical protein